MDLLHGSDSNVDISRPGRKTAATLSADAQSPNYGFFAASAQKYWKFLDGSGAVPTSTLDANILAALVAVGLGKPLSNYQSISLAAAITAGSITSTQAAQGCVIGGDTIYFNDSNLIEQRPDAAITIGTEGLQISSGSNNPSTDRVYLSAFEPTTNSNWTLSSSNLWECTLSSLSPAALSTSGLYQNRRPLTLQTSSANVAANPGSFYNDGTFFWVNPLDGVDPTTSASSGSFEYSGWMTGGASILNINADNILIRGLRTRGNAGTTSGPSSYGFQFNGGNGSGGLSVIVDCDTSNNSRHENGQTIGTTAPQNNKHIVMDCSSGKSASWLISAGGATTFVDFFSNSPSSGTWGNEVYYERVVVAEGHYEVQNQTGGGGGTASAQTWYAHTNGGSGSPIGKVWFVYCDFSLGGQLIDGTVLIPSITFWFCKLGFTALGSNGTGTGCQFYQPFYFSGTYTSCVFAFQSIGSFDSSTLGMQIYANNQPYATATLNKCTIDLTALYPGNTQAAFWFQGGGSTVNWTFTDCLIILPSGLALLNSSGLTPTIAFHNCKFQLASSSSHILTDYSGSSLNLTLAGLQAQGLADANCSVVTATQTLVPNYPQGETSPPAPSAQTYALLPSIYSPRSGSSLIGAGTDLGSAVDATEQTFAHRKSIGAYEPVSAATATASLTYGNFPAGAGSATLTFGNFKQS